MSEPIDLDAIERSIASCRSDTAFHLRSRGSIGASMTTRDVWVEIAASLIARVRELEAQLAQRNEADRRLVEAIDRLDRANDNYGSGDLLAAEDAHEDALSYWRATQPDRRGEA